MTTKDQAIAPTKELLALGAFLSAMYDNKLDGAEMRSAMLQTLSIEAHPPAPDCRTCWHLHTSDHGDSPYECTSKSDCTNGDQYKPAPAVVLWRTT